MKLQDLHEDREKSENDNLSDAPQPGNLGEFITTAQAAKILDVSMSRIRQFIMDGRLTAHHPVKGQRDNYLKLADVQQMAKKDRPITGRPDEGKGTTPEKKEKE